MAKVGDHNNRLEAFEDALVSHPNLGEYGLRGFLGGKNLPVRPPAPYSRAALRERPDSPRAAGAVGGNDGLQLSPGDNGDDGKPGGGMVTVIELRSQRRAPPCWQQQKSGFLLMKTECIYALNAWSRH
eukprot:COSAG05_NODE_8369_length_709_cov_2.440984_2_plen_128_part_00